MTTRYRMMAMALGSALALAAPAVAAPDFTGTFETQSGAVRGKGAGTIQMTITQRGSSLEWKTSTGYTYICSLKGQSCTGTWSGKTGSGWFDVKFTGNGDKFSGSWGYGSDHADSGTFAGSRR